MPTPPDAVPARLALSTGEVFHGRGFGAITRTDDPVAWTGEVVFNTAMSGYQESLTDPSYIGQILVQTTPMIGNTGVNAIDAESGGIRVSGLVVHEYVDRHSSYRALASLDDALRRGGVPGISGVDTRALTMILRSRGVTMGVLSSDTDRTDAQLVGDARHAPGMAGSDLASGAAGETTEPTPGVDAWRRVAPASGERVCVALIDCGAKDNIARCLIDAGADPVAVPMDTSADSLRSMLIRGEIRGVMLSNGPGDPAALAGLVATVRALLEDPELERSPIYGICLGHQILALAMGATTYKLPFGHRGINHPILDEDDGRVLVTSQNHGFAVEADSWGAAPVRVSHVHLNDGTIGGLAHTGRPVRSVQFHPEGAPGPHDAAPFFEDFVRQCWGH